MAMKLALAIAYQLLLLSESELSSEQIVLFL